MLIQERQSVRRCSFMKVLFALNLREVEKSVSILVVSGHTTNIHYANLLLTTIIV